MVKYTDVVGRVHIICPYSKRPFTIFSVLEEFSDKAGLLYFFIGTVAKAVGWARILPHHTIILDSVSVELTRSFFKEVVGLSQKTVFEVARICNIFNSRTTIYTRWQWRLLGVCWFFLCVEFDEGVISEVYKILNARQVHRRFLLWWASRHFEKQRRQLLVLGAKW